MSSKNALVVFIRPSSDHTRFFEDEIAWSTLERLTDNDVIEHVDLQNPGSFGQPASQPDISFARRRITGRMVVREDESISRLAELPAEKCPEDKPKTR